MESNVSKVISEIIQETQEKSKIEILLDQSNPVGNPCALMDCIEASANKIAKKHKRKDKKRQNRKHEKEVQFYSKLAKEEKDRLNRLRRCEERQRIMKERNDRFALARRNSGDSGAVSEPVYYSSAPVSPPLCKDCGKKHW